MKYTLYFRVEGSSLHHPWFSVLIKSLMVKKRPMSVFSRFFIRFQRRHIILGRVRIFLPDFPGYLIIMNYMVHSSTEKNIN